jgi:hypothetical protein
MLISDTSLAIDLKSITLDCTGFGGGKMSITHEGPPPPPIISTFIRTKFSHPESECDKFLRNVKINALHGVKFQ